MSDFVPLTQYGHKTCILLGLPHAEHLFNEVISFNLPLPLCMYRCRFFICEVFFLGTARRTDSFNDSHRSWTVVEIAATPPTFAGDCVELRGMTGKECLIRRRSGYVAGLAGPWTKFPSRGCRNPSKGLRGANAMITVSSRPSLSLQSPTRCGVRSLLKMMRRSESGLVASCLRWLPARPQWAVVFPGRDFP